MVCAQAEAPATSARRCPVSSYQIPDKLSIDKPLQINLTWLDLSFNQITKIEGLAGLTKLQDLSLFSNGISVIEGLDTMADLNVLSIGGLL